ncbi:MAG: GTPase SAR1 family protein [Cryomorphaceae bacterium]
MVRVDEQDVNLMLWDIAGSEDHFSVPMHYIKGASGYLLIIDGTRRESLLRAIDLVNLIEDQIGNLLFVAVVNKSDLEWEISHQEIEQSLSSFDQVWFATSAKTGGNIELAFAAIAERIV